MLAPMLIGMGDSTPNGNLVGMQVNIPLVACGQIPQISIALRICTSASSDNLVFVYRNKHIGVLADKHLEKLFIRRHKPPEAQPVGMLYDRSNVRHHHLLQALLIHPLALHALCGGGLSL